MNTRTLILILMAILITAKIPVLAEATSKFTSNQNISFQATSPESSLSEQFLHELLMIENNSNPVKTIVIDPGHGGRDPGGLGKKTKEKDIVLSIGLILEELIKRHFPDVNVIMTRKEDVFVPLHERANIANKARADLFISIHCNVAPNRPNVKGTETFVLGLHRAQENLEVAKRENAVIALEEDYEEHYGGYDPNSPVGHIIFSAYQNAYLGHSIRFASLVEQEFETTARRHSRGVKQAGFLVLRQATMPSVLVEAGFLSNPEEEKYLASLEGQRDIALSILRAVQQYLRDWGYEPTAVPVARASAEDARAEDIHPADIVEKPKTVPQPDTQKESTPALVKDAYYSVQLFTSSSEIDTESMNPINNQSFFTLREEGLFRLANGKFIKYEEAVQQREKLRKNGYQDAFIIGIIGNARVPVSEMLSAQP
jgi:N-acetylmuramoyl-L-alanine amidase